MSDKHEQYSSIIGHTVSDFFMGDPFGSFGSKGLMEIERHCLKRYEVLTGIIMKITVFWYVTPYSLVKIYCSSKHGLRQ